MNMRGQLDNSGANELARRPLHIEPKGWGREIDLDRQQCTVLRQDPQDIKSKALLASFPQVEDGIFLSTIRPSTDYGKRIGGRDGDPEFDLGQGECMDVPPGLV